MLYDKVRSEPDITLLLDTVLYAVRMEGQAILQVMAPCDKTEFNESLGLERPDRQTLGSSILFTSRDYGRPAGTRIDERRADCPGV